MNSPQRIHTNHQRLLVLACLEEPGVTFVLVQLSELYTIYMFISVFCLSSTMGGYDKQWEPTSMLYWRDACNLASSPAPQDQELPEDVDDDVLPEYAFGGNVRFMRRKV